MRFIRDDFAPQTEYDVLRERFALPMFSAAEIRALAEFLEQRTKEHENSVRRDAAPRHATQGDDAGADSPGR